MPTALMINGNMEIETINGRDTNILSTEKGKLAQSVVGLETNAKLMIRLMNIERS